MEELNAKNLLENVDEEDDMDVDDPCDDTDAVNPFEGFPIKKQWLDKIKNPDMNFHTLAGHVSEVFSVKIYCNSFAQQKTCEIYGIISIEVEDGTSYELYSREPDDPDIVSPEDNTLVLNMPDECAVTNTWVCMRISLKHRANNAVIVEEVFGLDVVNKDYDFDQVRVQQVFGIGGSASVSYGALSTALLAVVEIMLVKKDKSDDLPANANANANADADVYGRIVAHYGNTYGKRFPGILLFKKPPNQCARVVSQTTIELSRNQVAVPAYSFLSIEIDLWDSNTNQQVVNRKAKAEFLPKDLVLYTEKIQGEDFLVQVNVEWYHPYELENHIQKPPEIHTDQLPRPTLSSSSYPSLRKHQPVGSSLVEVFTVMIGHSRNSDLSLFGRVQVRDSLTKHTVFDRDEKNPETLSASNRTISVAGPCQKINGPSESNSLAMYLDLGDVQGRIAIKGTISWNLGITSIPISWLDRRMCSIIRGVYGYAAVHYSIFSRAVQALVKVFFISGGSLDVSHRVYGNIVARYSTQDYCTKYEQANYQSILFKEPPQSASELRSGCTIPLLKSVVYVPIDASLIVELDLHSSSSSDGFPEEHLKDTAKFRVDHDASFSAAVQGKNYRIAYSVEWSELSKLYK